MENLSNEQLIELLSTREKQLISKEKQIVSKEKTLDEKEEEVIRLKVLVAMLKRMKFGAQSERFLKQVFDPGQLHLSFEDLSQKSDKGPDTGHICNTCVP